MRLVKRNVAQVEHHELQSQRTGERFSMSAVLSEGLGLRDLFVHHEIIPAGRRASGAHFHSRREEMVFVLEGTVIAWCNGEELVLHAGEAMAFPAGEGNAHCLINRSEQSARVLVMANNPDGDEVHFVASNDAKP